ncbi:MAG: recombinase A [Candidatus Hydrogenedentota bacterium]
MATSAAHISNRIDLADRVTLARDLIPKNPTFERWGLDALAGRLVELNGGAETATLTLAASLVVATQHRRGLVAWVTIPGSEFFPPDFAAAGIDLNALPIVRVPNGRASAKAADILLRSRAFSLIVLDITTLRDLPLSIQTQLTGLAKSTNTTVLCITHQSETPGSLVSFRGRTRKSRTGHDCFTCEIETLKDKRNPPGGVHQELCHGADGLC